MNCPMRCFECGKVLGNKWETFFNLTGRTFDFDQMKIVKNEEDAKFQDDNACDKLGLLRNCCRNIMKSHVEY